MVKSLMLTGLACTLLMAPWVTGAEILRDPTLPPDFTANGEIAVPSGPVLQSIIRGPGYKGAIISGELVRLGHKYGDATLLNVSDQRAELRYPDGVRETLMLHPAVEKRPSLTNKRVLPVK